MHANGHTTVWGTHIAVNRARDTKNWYQQIQDWWTAYKAARRDAKLATLRARWDARREVVHPLHADAAIDWLRQRMHFRQPQHSATFPGRRRRRAPSV